jgi:GNAT superfamily N-acetyltransferase
MNWGHIHCNALFCGQEALWCYKGPKGTPMSLTVRPAVPDDVPVLFDMINEAYKVEIGDRGLAWKTTDRYAAASDINVSEMIVVTEPGSEDEIVACARVALIESDLPCYLSGTPGPYDSLDVEKARRFSRCGVPTAMFGPFTVSKKRQRAGLGAKVLVLIENRARELGAAGIEIVVANWRTDVQPFYSKRGYSFVYSVPYNKPSFTRAAALYILRKPL